jgi:Protein of unknown function (DUF664)
VRPVDIAPELADPRALLLAHLDRCRLIVAAKLEGLTDDDLRASRLPSGWSPLELAVHLLYMERRWVVWGFRAEPVPDPWGDVDPATGRWTVGPEDTRESVIAAMRTQGARTRTIAEGAGLTAIAARGGRFGADKQPPTLVWILCHVLQEYSRHCGHLDVARELIDGAVGE